MPTKDLFSQAQAVIAGGVNSPVRSCQAMGCPPLYLKQAQGAEVVDEDGRTLIDYVGGFGPQLLGHSHPAIVQAVQDQAARMTCTGTCHAQEIAWAQLILQAIPHVEQVRMTNSGTEAAMAAVRLARAVTSRNKIVKFNGCYHGHVDALLVQAGSGALGASELGSPGVHTSSCRDTMVMPYNRLDAMEQLMKVHGMDVAAIMVEPVAGNMGCILPKPGFLAGLRTLADRYGALLVFDEVMTGFRVAHGGAQARYQVAADMVLLGKVIGGGLPVGAIAAKRTIMEQLAPTGPVYLAGTLSGNPLTVAAGIAMLETLQQQKDYVTHLERLAGRLVHGLAAHAKSAGLPFQAQICGAMMGVFFQDEPMNGLEDATPASQAYFKSFYLGMRAAGIMLPPSAAEAWFLSLAHTEEHVDKTIRAAEGVFQSMMSKVN